MDSKGRKENAPVCAFLARGSGVLTHKKQQVRAVDFPTKAPILSHQFSALMKNE